MPPLCTLHASLFCVCSSYADATTMPAPSTAAPGRHYQMRAGPSTAAAARQGPLPGGPGAPFAEWAAAPSGLGALSAELAGASSGAPGVGGVPLFAGLRRNGRAGGGGKKPEGRLKLAGLSRVGKNDGMAGWRWRGLGAKWAWCASDVRACVCIKATGSC